VPRTRCPGPSGCCSCYKRARLLDCSLKKIAKAASLRRWHHAASMALLQRKISETGPAQDPRSVPTRPAREEPRAPAQVPRCDGAPTGAPCADARPLARFYPLPWLPVSYAALAADARRRPLALDFRALGNRLSICFDTCRPVTLIATGKFARQPSDPVIAQGNLIFNRHTRADGALLRHAAGGPGWKTVLALAVPGARRQRERASSSVASTSAKGRPGRDGVSRMLSRSGPARCRKSRNSPDYRLCPPPPFSRSTTVPPAFNDRNDPRQHARSRPPTPPSATWPRC